MFGRRDGTDQAKKKRVMIHETTLENDIRFRGIFTYQHFKMLGWLCIVIAQVAIVLRLGGRINADLGGRTAAWAGVLEEIANLALPFLLIANFAQILDAENGYKKQLIFNGAAMAGLCALYYLVFYRYIVGSFSRLLEKPSEALPAVQSAVKLAAPYGFIDFNLFIDLFLCTLTMVFLNYKPRHIFKGKARILFRLLALLPIAYEAACMVLKVLSAKAMLEIPMWAYPLLTVKPPMTFVLFVALALFVKTRELRFRRHGKTHEEYKAFLKTRRNSLNFSVFLAVMLVVVSLVDFAITIGFSVGNVAFDMVKGRNEYVAQVEQLDLAEEEKAALVREMENSTIDKEQLSQSIDSSIRIGWAVGFGESMYMILLAPVVLLFSYTRKPKYRLLDLLTPAAGVILIVFVYLEGFHWLMGYLPFEKLNLTESKEMAGLYLDLFTNTGV